MTALAPPCLDGDQPARPGADVYRLYAVLDRLVTVPRLADTAVVRLTGAAQLLACEECSPPEGEPVPGEVVVRYGHAAPVYEVHVCEGCVVPVVLRRLRYDRAAPVVEIPTGLL